MTTELDRWVKNQKIAVFHWTFQRVGGGEILASYLGKALNCKVYCIGQSKLGFEDLSYLLPRPMRLFKRVRSFEYMLWSSINIEELGDFDIIISSGATPRAIIAPEYTMHVNYCLDEDTKILVRVNGLYRILPIKHVEGGMEVLSVDKRGRVFFNKVVAKRFTGYREDMYRVRVRGGREVICTSDHTFYAYNKIKKRFEFVECKDLIPNVHFIPLVRKIPEPERYIETIDVVETLRKHIDNPDIKDRVFVSLDGSYICMGNLGNKTAKVPTKIALTNELAELIGYYIAEGCMHRRNRNRRDFDVFITVGFHEPHLAEKIRELSKRCFSFEPKIHEHRHGHCIQVRFPNVFGVLFKYVFGLGAKSTEQRIPDWVLNTPLEFRKSLLMAYLEGDGHYYEEYNKYQSNTVSYDLAESLLTLISSIGYWATLVKSTYSKNKSTTYHIVTFLSDRYLPNKLPKYENVIPISENVVLTPVISIEKESGRNTYDITVSGNHLFTLANGLVVHNCHSPPRWLYDLWNFRRKRLSSIKRFIIDFIGEALRIWDYAVDTRVDYYFVNSEVIRFRLWKYLKRDSVVLYPPIEWNKYKCNESEDFILFLSRLEPEKRVEEAIEACIRAGQKIVVVGTGTLEKRIREKYGNNGLVDVRGFVDEKEKIELLSSCKAVIFPAVAEDFGIVPIEALASGKPVIVDNTGFPPILLNKTGFVEQNGVFKICKGGIITRGNVANLTTAVKLLDKYSWDSEYLRNFAKQFDFEYFKLNLVLNLKIWKEKFDKFRFGEEVAL